MSLEQAVESVVREFHARLPRLDRVRPAPDAEWAKVRAAGTRLWLDTGDLDEAAALWTADFEALTTNNTLLNREVQKGIYDDLMGRAAAELRRADPGIDDRRLVLEIAFILNALHGLRLVDRFDAFVSVELHTDLADDAERSVAYGRRYHRLCPERFYVKVPLTPAGLLGARRLGAAGIPVNFTLGFSARQNVVAALVANPTFVNVFMGRLNAFAADNRLGDGRNVGEKATLATQRALRTLRAAGRTRSRLIGASMRDGGQVTALAGVDVYTMPPKVAAAWRAKPPASVAPQVDQDPAVGAAPGVRLEDYNASSLWEVPEAFARCAEGLLRQDLDRLAADGLLRYFAERGFGDFLPAWSAQDLATATADGKIPIYEKWKARLRAGAIGLDALMNVSALRSFVTDQKALDDRIESKL
jgi:transaldolase